MDLLDSSFGQIFRDIIEHDEQRTDHPFCGDKWFIKRYRTNTEIIQRIGLYLHDNRYVKDMSFTTFWVDMMEYEQIDFVKLMLFYETVSLDGYIFDILFDTRPSPYTISLRILYPNKTLGVTINFISDINNYLLICKDLCASIKSNDRYIQLRSINVKCDSIKMYQNILSLIDCAKTKVISRYIPNETYKLEKFDLVNISFGLFTNINSLINLRLLSVQSIPCLKLAQLLNNTTSLTKLEINEWNDNETDEYFKILLTSTTLIKLKIVTFMMDTFEPIVNFLNSNTLLKGFILTSYTKNKFEHLISNTTLEKLIVTTSLIISNSLVESFLNMIKAGTIQTIKANIIVNGENTLISKMYEQFVNHRALRCINIFDTHYNYITNTHTINDGYKYDKNVRTINKTLIEYTL